MGNRQSKPGVDWAAIRAGFEQGMTYRALAAQSMHAGAPLTHRAIQRRAKAEGWNAELAALAGLHKLPSVVAQARGMSRTHVRTEANAEQILKLFLKGLPKTAICQQVGITFVSLNDWLKDDEDFCAKVEAAQSVWHEKQIDHIDAAAERGDWKAAQFRLAHNPATRAMYQQQGAAGPSITVTLNLGRDGDKPAVVIDGKAETVEEA